VWTRKFAYTHMFQLCSAYWGRGDYGPLYDDASVSGRPSLTQRRKYKNETALIMTVWKGVDKSLAL
jgi:hypothetical protein